MKRIAILVGVWMLSSWAAADDPVDPIQRRQKMAARIDRLLAERWQLESLSPSPPTTDAEFMRRLYLDLTGVIPRVSQVREFLADTSGDKRARLIDQLVASPAHATHMANTWRGIMLPGNLGIEELQNVAGVQNWLRSQFIDNMRYDRMVGDLLVATGGGDQGPALYYTAMELEPEKLAASTSRIFLGLQIDCAQCHDHPFDHWTQQDFWGYAAFFARLQQPDQMIPGRAASIVDLPDGEVTLPETETVVLPKYPNGAAANEDDFGTRRDKLAVWMASRDNPYLAKAAANRVWAQMFGRGLVEPVDDLGDHNPPSHPQLFQELTDYFVAIDFDMRELLRTIASTDAYQLSSRTSGEQPRADLFAAMAIKPLTAEQLYDSLNRSLGRPLQSVFGNQNSSSPLFDQRRLAFISKMQSQSRSATEFDAGVPYALTLMNGQEVKEATGVGTSRLLAALGAPFFSDQQRLETLFLATVSRPPEEDEQIQFTAYLQQNGKNQAARKRAFSDILWALMNSAEFALNH